VPVIAVTAAVIGQETDQLMAEGATAVLSKPIKVDELAKVLSRQKAEEAV
jgi:CheY-like chemotaxis protein